MNNKEFNERFEQEVLPGVVEQFESDGIADPAARRFAYQSFKTELLKAEEITHKQFNEWVIPHKLTGESK